MPGFPVTSPHPRSPGRRLRVGRIARAILAGFLLTAAGAQTPGPDEFPAALKKALETRDEKALLSFADGEGLSEADRRTHAESLRGLLEAGPVYSVTLGPLPDDYAPFFIVNGKRYEPTHPAAGVVTISFRREGGLTSTQLAYAVVDGGCRIVATKGTDLGWKGPPDANIGFYVDGYGADSVLVKARFNASGVDVERTFHDHSASLWGQHFESVEVSNDDPKAHLVLKIYRDGQEIYRSEPLKGAGKITYAGDKPRADSAPGPGSPSAVP